MGAQFFKSRYLSSPTVYIQEDGHWRSVGPGGVVTTKEGEIPQSIMTGVVAIQANEAHPLLTELYGEVQRIEAEKASPIRQRLTGREWGRFAVASVAGLVVYFAAELAATLLKPSWFTAGGYWLYVGVEFIVFFVAGLAFAFLSPRVSSWEYTVLFVVGIMLVNLVLTSIIAWDGEGLVLALIFGSLPPAAFGMLAGLAARRVNAGLRGLGIKSGFVGAALSGATVVFALAILALKM
jgi:hypothetical protein